MGRATRPRQARGASARTADRRLRGHSRRLPPVGDERCNRTAYGVYVGERYVQLLDDRVAAELEVRDAFFHAFGGMDFDAPHLPIKLVRVLARYPRAIPVTLRWLGRFVRRARLRALLRHGAQPITFVMHSFMDAEDVRPAWDGLQRGEISDDPRIRATQERLQACSYAMAHPESDTLVPACVQHAVLDPRENLALSNLLPSVDAEETGAPARAGAWRSSHEPRAAAISSSTVGRSSGPRLR